MNILILLAETVVLVKMNYGKLYSRSNNLNVKVLAYCHMCPTSMVSVDQDLLTAQTPGKHFYITSCICIFLRETFFYIEGLKTLAV